MEETLLREIAAQIGELNAMYRLVNRDRITRARDEVLGDGRRRELWEACDGTRTQADLARLLEISQQRISQLMSDLTEAGMIGRNEEGKLIRRLT